MAVFDLPWKTSRAVNLPSPWLQENIWGHRLHIGSNQEIVFLEFLNILESKIQQQQTLFQETDDKPIHISLRRSLATRFLIFGSKSIEKCYSDSELTTESQKWELYFELLRGDYDAQIHSSYWSAYDFSYLKDRFTDFEEYYQTIKLLGRLRIKVANSTRWTSNFLFPFSSEALYEDVEVSKTQSPTNKRNLFGRSGELVYLMLSRSKYKNEVAAAFESLLFEKSDENNLMSELLKKIMPPVEMDGSSYRGEFSSIGYLPYTSCKAFDLMAEDILQLFNSGLPKYDLFPHLSRMIMFHLQNYFLRISHFSALDTAIYNDGCTVSQKVPYVIEIRSLQRDGVRKLSENCFQFNKSASRQRILSELEKIKSSAEFKDALLTVDNAKIYLKKQFNIDYESNYNNQAMVEEELSNIISSKVINKYESDLEDIPQTYAKWCGFASKKGSRSYRYAPTDEFLRTIVLANVEKRMDLQDFLDRLWERYGFIITQEQARNFPLQDGSLEDFEHNLERYKAKLTKLGLLRSLSDWCSFVLNRYNEELLEEV